MIRNILKNICFEPMCVNIKESITTIQYDIYTNKSNLEYQNRKNSMDVERVYWFKK